MTTPYDDEINATREAILDLEQTDDYSALTSAKSELFVLVKLKEVWINKNT